MLKISINNKNPNVKKYKDVLPGEVFRVLNHPIFEDVYFLKVRSNESIGDRSVEAVNLISFYTAALGQFAGIINGDNLCEVLGSELNISIPHELHTRSKKFSY